MKGYFIIEHLIIFFYIRGQPVTKEMQDPRVHKDYK